MAFADSRDLSRTPLFLEEMMQKLRTVALLTLFFAALASSQSGLMLPSSAADVTGTAATVQIISAGGNARWVQLIALAANSAAVRCGDSAVTVSRGAAIAAGGGLMFPPIVVSGDLTKQPLYNLGAIYCYIGSGDKVSVIWAK